MDSINREYEAMIKDAEEWQLDRDLGEGELIEWPKYYKVFDAILESRITIVNVA